MDFEPKVPAKSHIKKGTVITSRRENSFDFDTRINETGGVDSNRTGRWTMRSERSRHGNGRRMGVELVPKPSKLAADPLNWSRTRKEIVYATILLTVASLAPLKMLLVTVASVTSTQLNVSYTATTALTGIPLIIGALAGMGARVLSQTSGKRGFLLSSTSLALIGALWNMHVYGSYAQFMVSRIFQGIGWGVFETLAGHVIDDLFFVHERRTRTVIYNIVSIIFTWGSPILGGYVSQSTEGYMNQIMIINIIQAFSILLLILGVPETSFDRAAIDPVLPLGITTTAVVSRPQEPKTGIKAYLATLRLRTPHSTPQFSISRALRPIKALYAPSTVLTTLLTAPLLASAYGSIHSISLLFSAMPTFLFPARIGYISILPLFFALLFYILAATTVYLCCRPPRHLNTSVQGTELGAATVGMIVSVVGLLAWGLYTVGELGIGEYSDNGLVFSLSVTGLDLSLRKVSLLLGLLVGGATVLSNAGNAFLAEIGAPAGQGDGIGREMARAHKILEEIVVGIWVCGMSGWIAGDGNGDVMQGLRSVVVALAVLCMVMGSSVCAILWVKGRELAAVDDRILGVKEDDYENGMSPIGGKGLKRWGTSDSFID